MDIGKHLHVVIWAAEGKTDQGYSGVTYIDLIAKDVEDAKKQAVHLVPGRQFYWINNIIQHHGHGTDK